MRYFFAFLLGFALLSLTVFGIAGRRGTDFRKPPLEIFDDMVRQAKLRPQVPNSFFADGRSSQPHVPGTVAQRIGGMNNDTWQGTAKNTGMTPGTTNFVATIPVPVTSALLARGRERYNISCLPCHGAVGDGNGITKKIGAMPVVANLLDKNAIVIPDGQIFQIISQGKAPNMQGYAANITIEDRWAIVAYVRSLQRARFATLDEVPAADRATLK
ncbi:MAG: cytochrome c [Verrucomicrobia bacterium]|nr:cytochrome c [Verrucomicrobiota bacterium]NBU10815.1 cytochrome c [Pseudomonadota bacterium]NDA67481.1 cytochrome c [Verrucomicrobiota bacterium]NDB76253.1 cytochrome c [Verrucomicrobiota bacterium]NDD39311.1 cytochrome c [Verrucomicrobiota bacterium]